MNLPNLQKMIFQSPDRNFYQLSCSTKRGPGPPTGTFHSYLPDLASGQPDALSERSWADGCSTTHAAQAPDAGIPTWVAKEFGY